ncbi:LuxR C-terminal-related transcriptional regulator [Tenacibaculum xiamenense]|uniref:LuxR C-terminal-related transcriptional regulator n=1 Tax=Tenacibaculum xiamenense TaxID=1261553 RepID=UPI003894C429
MNTDILTTELFGNLRTTKFHIPAKRKDTIIRKRLNDLLEKCLQAKVTLVNAPAGYGKSTSVAMWGHQCKHRLCWLSIDEKDRQVATFLKNVLGALLKIDAVLVKGMDPFFMSSNFDTHLFLSKLINNVEQFKEDIVLVLDDYHIIDITEINSVMKLLTSTLPDNFHLIITSRRDIGLGVSKLRVNRQLVEITKEDLAFTKEEIAFFFKNNGKITIDSYELEFIEKKTEGWIVSIQLLALSGQRLKENALTKKIELSEKYLTEYIVEEILENLDESTRKFVYASSLLYKFNSEIMNYILSISEGKEYLKELNKANLFLIGLDYENNWYRYHHLFGKLLKNEFLKENPSEAAMFFKRAAKWYFDNGDIENAINYAFESGDNELINHLIEESMLPLILNGELSLLFSWFERITMDKISSCMVKVWLAWIYIFSEQMDMTSIDNHLNEISKELQEKPEQAIKYPTIHIHILAIKGFIASHLGDTITGIDYCTQALREFPDSELFLRGTIAYNIVVSHYIECNIHKASKFYDIAIYDSLKGKSLYGAITSIFYKGQNEMAGGKFHLAEKTYNGALSLVQEFNAQNFGFNAYNYVGLGRLYYLWNRIEKAEEYLKKGVDLGLAGGETMSSLYGLMYLSQVYGAKKEKNKAFHTIKKANELGSALSIPIRKLEVDAIEADLFLRLNEPTKIKDWAAPYLKINQHIFNVLTEIQATVLVRFLIRSNDYKNASEILSWLGENQLKRERFGMYAETLLLNSINLYKQGKREKAISIFVESVRYVQKEGVIQMFIRELPMVTVFLDAIKENTAYTDVFNFMISHINNSKTLGKRIHNKFNLSNRELDVLLLLEEKHSNREIAELLFISIGTVKRHVHNIFDKMNVRDRNEAIEKSKSVVL